PLRTIYLFGKNIFLTLSPRYLMLPAWAALKRWISPYSMIRIACVRHTKNLLTEENRLVQSWKTKAGILAIFTENDRNNRWSGRGRGIGKKSIGCRYLHHKMKWYY